MSFKVNFCGQFQLDHYDMVRQDQYNWKLRQMMNRVVGIGQNQNRKAQGMHCINISVWKPLCWVLKCIARQLNGKSKEALTAKAHVICTIDYYSFFTYCLNHAIPHMGQFCSFQIVQINVLSPHSLQSRFIYAAGTRIPLIKLLLWFWHKPMVNRLVLIALWELLHDTLQN